MSFIFQLSVPAKLVLREEAEGVTLPGETGVLTVLPHHTHMVALLKPGSLHYSKKDAEGNMQRHEYRIAGGVAEMSRKGTLTVFTDSADLA